MNDQPHTYKQDQIDAYLRGEGDPATRLEMDRARTESQALEEELAFGEALVHTIKASGRQTLKSEIKAWDAAMAAAEDTNSRPKGGIRPLWMGIAGLAIAAALAIFFLTRSPAPIPPEQLLAQHIQAYPNLVVVVARAQTKSKGTLDSAFTAYEQGRYAQAFSLMENLQDSLPASTLAFYRANVLMMEGNFAAARDQFEQLAGQADAPFQREAQWYQALMHIKTGDSLTGKRLMNQIAETPNHPFAPDAAVWQNSLP